MGSKVSVVASYCLRKPTPKKTSTLSILLDRGGAGGGGGLAINPKNILDKLNSVSLSVVKKDR